MSEGYVDKDSKVENDRPARSRRWQGVELKVDHNAVLNQLHSAAGRGRAPKCRRFRTCFDDLLAASVRIMRKPCDVLDPLEVVSNLPRRLCRRRRRRLGVSRDGWIGREVGFAYRRQGYRSRWVLFALDNTVSRDGVSTSTRGAHLGLLKSTGLLLPRGSTPNRTLVCSVREYAGAGTRSAKTPAIRFPYEELFLGAVNLRLCRIPRMMRIGIYRVATSASTVNYKQRQSHDTERY